MPCFSSLIVYEDRHLLLAYKPHGLPPQPDSSGDPCLLDYGKWYLIDRYHKTGGAYLALPHRLDRPVAGLCLMAKTSKAMQRLCAAFSSQQCRKFYLAVVEGSFAKPIEGWQQQTDYLRKDARNNKSYIMRPMGPQTDTQGKLAILRYRLLLRAKRYSVLAVYLQTGRHHQIRCQLAAMGSPIRGDLKYGAKRSRRDGGISLYAFALQVPMPIAATSGHCSARHKSYTWPHAWQASCHQVDGTSPQVLRSICLPWQWHASSQSARPTTDQSIWQLCQAEPQLLQTVHNIFEPTGAPPI